MSTQGKIFIVLSGGHYLLWRGSFVVRASLLTGEISLSLTDDWMEGVIWERDDALDILVEMEL